MVRGDHDDLRIRRCLSRHPLGKVLAAITAIFSIGFIALPTGILASAFSDAVQRHKSRTDEED